MSRLRENRRSEAEGRRGSHRQCRRWLRESWGNYRWTGIALLHAAALALGYQGFSKYFAALGEPRSPLDLLYLTLQLFIMESGSTTGPVVWELEAARYLAPGVAAYTAVRTLAVILREQLQLVRARRFNDHVVVCGLGQKGYLLTKRFRKRGDRVVVIEQDEGNDLIEQSRDLGALVLVGSATNEALLGRAGVDRARCLISVCRDDGVNAEVAVRAAALVEQRRRRPLTCILHIVDPQLCELLKEREIEAGEVDAVRVEFFNVYDSGARELLRLYPPSGGAQDDQAHVLVVGAGRMGQSLIVHAARSWRASRPAGGRRLRVTLIDSDAEGRAECLRLRYPALGEVCELHPLSIGLRSAEFQRGGFLVDKKGRAVRAVYVCVEEDSLGLSAALTLRQRLRDARVPIVVRMKHEAGLGKLLAGRAEGGGAFENLHAFSLLQHTCSPDILLGGTHEVIARAVHEGYLSYRQGLQTSPAEEPAMAAWDDLAEEYRESCRRQADHIGRKLQAVGCAITRLTDWDTELLEFVPQETEAMARMEHERWMEERIREGWTCGPRDAESKTNPLLVPWEELPEATKELNRDMVRALPAFLADVDLQVHRLERPSGG